MNELADRIVALGVGGLSKIQENGYRIGRTFNLTADQFTHSWEVAGALMNKVIGNEWLINIAHDGTVYIFTGIDGIGEEKDGVFFFDIGTLKEHSNALPHAINLACVEALEAA